MYSDYFIYFLSSLTAVAVMIGTHFLWIHKSQLMSKSLEKMIEVYTHLRLIKSRFYIGDKSDKRTTHVNIERAFLICQDHSREIDMKTMDNCELILSFLEGQDQRLEIHYSIGNTDFCIVFPNPTKINKRHLDLLTQDRDPDIEWEDVQITGLRDADQENKVIETLQKYAGPSGNFHRHIEDSFIKAEWLLDHRMEPLLRKDGEIRITDTLGNVLRL